MSAITDRARAITIRWIWGDMANYIAPNWRPYAEPNIAR